MFRKILFFLLLSTVSTYAQDNSGPQPTCFDVKILPENNPFYVENKDQYVVCMDQKITITPTLNAPLRRTDMYDVGEIAFNPYPVTGGTDIFVSTDDAFADAPVPLPFKFCFFDNTYTNVYVHGNGYLAFSGTGQPQSQQINDPQFSLPSSQQGYPNTIMMYKHTHWNSTRQGTLSYRVYGEAPCRVFVVTWFNMLAYQVAPVECPPHAIPGQTHQIALHETTNIIDIVVTQHNGCPLDARGAAVMGINNPTGTVAYTPPGKNQSTFDIPPQNSWRFTPSGEKMWRMEWAVDGVIVNNNDAPFDVIVDKSKLITARLIAETCEEEYVDKYEIRVRPAIDLDAIELERLVVCDKNQNTYNLNELSQMVKDSQPDVDPAELAKLKFLYYPTEDDATNKTKQITTPREYPINMGENVLYVRVETEIADCFEIAKAVIIKAPVEVKTPVHVNLCEKYTLPVLTDDEFYYKLERLDEDGNFVVETLPQPNENQIIDKVGYYKVSIKKTNEYECEDVKSFILFVENCSYPKGISPNGDGENDYLDLTYNNVQELKVFNRHGKLVYEHGKGYKRQWSGQDNNGNILPSGTYFLNIKTKNYEYQDWIQLMYELK